MTVGTLIYAFVLIVIICLIVAAILWAVREFGTPEPLAKIIRVAVILIAILIVLLLLLNMVGMGLGTSVLPSG